jgi:Putative auto-transporter adhesin, head GIN domain
MKSSLSLLLWALSVLPAGAQTADAGKVYQPGPFDSIVVEGSANVRFTQGPVDQVTIDGDEAAHKAVQLDLRGSRLVVRTKGTWWFGAQRHLQLNVTARSLRQLSISGASNFRAAGLVQGEQLAVSTSGAGQVRFDQLQVQQLSFDVSGAGDGVFAGQTRELNVDISGKGKFDGENLYAEQGRVSISGVGDAAVWVTRALRVSVSGAGTVDYWGSPNLRPSISGLGSITPRGDKPAPR